LKKLLGIVVLGLLLSGNVYAAKSKYCAQTGLSTLENIRYFAKSKPSVILSTHRPSAFVILPNKCVSDTYNVAYKEVSSSLFQKLIAEFDKYYVSLGGTKDNNETNIVEKKKPKEKKKPTNATLH